MVKENWLQRLQTLKLRSCTSLKIVPFFPPHLQRLVVENCHELMQLPLSDTLLDLWLINCSKLQALANLSPNLTIAYCPNLTPPSMFDKTSSLWDLLVLTNLQRLTLEGLPNLQALTNLSPTVIDLDIVNCQKLTSLGNLQRCTSLKMLFISGCPMLTSMGNVQRCTSLVRLHIFRCPMLRREEASLVEGVVEGDIANHLPQLVNINTDAPSLVLELVGQQAFSSTKHLDLFKSDSAALPNLEMLSSLWSLNIHCCDDLESLPNLPVSLQSLCIERCPKLLLKEKYEEGGPLHIDLKGCAALSNLEKLSSLDILVIAYCPAIESLPKLPISLQELHVYGCPKLKEKYEEGGPLRNTISHIPDIHFYD